MLHKNKEIYYSLNKYTKYLIKMKSFNLGMAIIKHFIWENKLIEVILYISWIEIAIGLIGEVREAILHK